MRSGGAYRIPPIRSCSFVSEWGQAMACEDRYGLPLSTTSEAAAAAYRNGVDLMLSAWPGAAEAFDAAIAADPDFALAHVARARMHFIYADPRAAQARVATARELVTR